MKMLSGRQRVVGAGFKLLLLVFLSAGYGRASIVRQWGYVVANPEMPDASPIAQINTGGDHVLALTANGHLVDWGYNPYGGALAPGGSPTFTKVAGGGYHSLALRPNGTVYAWGYNAYGQTNVPAGLSGVADIAARDDIS